jgi:hypothetical protein
MEANDLLNLKTTNINVRISPMLKSKLIEHGAKLGINLSDFIGYVLTKDMSGQNDPTLSDEYKDLVKKFQRLQAELARYQAVGKPYEDWLNKDFKDNGKPMRFEHPAELLAFFAKNFKIKA